MYITWQHGGGGLKGLAKGFFTIYTSRESQTVKVPTGFIKSPSIILVYNDDILGSTHAWDMSRPALAVYPFDIGCATLQGNAYDYKNPYATLNGSLTVSESKTGYIEIHFGSSFGGGNTFNFSWVAIEEGY